jgi:putative nucleotidyltransferase with HDIG domain
MMLKNKIYEGASFRSQAINLILNTLHEKNKREEQHSVRVSRICVEIGKAINLPENEVNKLKVIGLLHDIGKIGVSEAILNKMGKLTASEFEEIKKHSEIGYRILSSSPHTSEIAQDVLDHHERYDGRGYPRGKPGNKLSLMTRILTIADSYDAMTSERPYKSPMSKSEAIEELLLHSAKQFDPELVEVFINNVLNNSEIML